ncbi:MAG: nucleotidyltransferase domain-containing protein [Herpetosiphon sp.]|nr:nucleotidyltransferase domain-containing protein [Herpetosiphon sp.]
MFNINENQLNTIRSLCREYGVIRLEIFGSATRNDFEPQRSDIDLLVEFAETADLGPWMAHFFSLRQKLSAIFGRTVDLSMASSIRNPYLLQTVNRERQALYVA